MSSLVIFWQTPPSPSSDDVIYEQPLIPNHEVQALRQEAVDTVVGVVTEVAMATNHRSNIPLC